MVTWSTCGSSPGAVVAATGRRSVRGSIPDIPVAGQQALQFIREAGYLTGDLPHLLGQLLRQARIRIYHAANGRTQEVRKGVTVHV